MSRKIYETAADRQREFNAVHRFLRDHPGCTAQKLPPMFPADFRILNRRKRPVLYVEVKHRFCSWQKYPTYWISRSKLVRLSRAAARDGVLPMLLVEWEDALGYVNPNTVLAEANVTIGGRWDRNDEHDIERMADVPLDLFEFIEGGRNEAVA